MDRIPTLPVVLDSTIISRRAVVIALISAGVGAGANELFHRVGDRGIEEDVVAQEHHLIEREKELAIRIHDAQRVMNDIADGRLNHLVLNLRIRILQEWIDGLEKDRVENRDILNSNEALEGKLKQILEHLQQAIDILKQRQRPVPLNQEGQVV